LISQRGGIVSRLGHKARFKKNGETSRKLHPMQKNTATEVGERTLQGRINRRKTKRIWVMGKKPEQNKVNSNRMEKKRKN